MNPKVDINRLQSGSMDSDCIVFFTKLGEENEEFTNSFPCSFWIEGVRYNSVLQYMMSREALLFGDADAYKRVMEEYEPRDILRATR